MSHSYPFITILDAATAILGRPAQTGGDFDEAGLEIMGGCQNCGATLAAYNASPSRSGYWKCAGSCIGDDGFHTVSEFLLSVEDLSLADLEYFCENGKHEGTYAEVRAAARRLALASKAMQRALEAQELVVEWTEAESKDGACACGAEKPCEESMRCAVRGLVNEGVDLAIVVCGDHKRRVVEAQLAVKVCKLWAANEDRRAPALFAKEAADEAAADEAEETLGEIPSEDDLVTGDHVHFTQHGKLVLTVNADGWRWRSHPREQLPRVKLEPDDAKMHRALRAFMEHEQFFPDVWFISDHGNPHRIELREPLKSETDTEEMRSRVLAAFMASDHGAAPGQYGADFEHGQWFISNRTTGRQWSVVDAEGGPAIDGFDFEVVSEGEEE